MTQGSTRQVRWDAFRLGPHPPDVWTWRGMCGNGREVCGRGVGESRIRAIPISHRADARASRPHAIWPVCCGAARSSTTTGTCDVPIATGATRTIRSGSSDFGRCSQPFNRCDSGLCPSGFWGSPEAFTPLVAFRETHRCGRQSGQSRHLSSYPKAKVLAYRWSRYSGYAFSAAQL
jgi:hypothetical protein